MQRGKLVLDLHVVDHLFFCGNLWKRILGLVAPQYKQLKTKPYHFSTSWGIILITFNISQVKGTSDHPKDEISKETSETTSHMYENITRLQTIPS